MGCLENLRYSVYSSLDYVLDLSGYFETVVYCREGTIRSLQQYVSYLIEYFEDIPFIDADEQNKEKLNSMEQFLGRANSLLAGIHGFSRKLLNTIERDLLCVVMGGSDFYSQRRERLGSSKSIFDAKSSEIKHLLYMMDGGEFFMFRDLFIKVIIVKGRLVFELDRDTIEIRKLHEYEFSDEVRAKYKQAKAGEV
ncbi:MAG: hypothetical protein BWY44_01461 [Candidatus Omnitrophica bacterium ADurb.Bin292]|nr:MAG: hypothetical protein BWY44_01461 [Candidatus Omnitrophica bacterium ADurb.Bin292]